LNGGGREGGREGGVGVVQALRLFRLPEAFVWVSVGRVKEGGREGGLGRADEGGKEGEREGIVNVMRICTGKGRNTRRGREGGREGGREEKK